MCNFSGNYRVYLHPPVAETCAISVSTGGLLEIEADNAIDEGTAITLSGELIFDAEERVKPWAPPV